MFPWRRRGAHIDLLILQASSFCNIDCRYCYVLGRDRRERMSDVVVESIARNVLPAPAVPDELPVAWHAGEPLALPVDWMDAACETLAAGARPGQRLHHGIQTNGMLIDDRWIEFFRRRRVSVGVSIDGPPEIHDAYRVTRRGGGTYARTRAGIERLKEAGMAFDVIAVLTRKSLAMPEALFDFFHELGPRSLGFNIEEIEGPHRTSTLATEDAPRLYGRFLRRFLVLHHAAGEPFLLRPLEQLRSAVAGRKQRLRGNDQIEPLSILTVGVDGAYSTYSPELIGYPETRFADFIFGNVRAGPPDSVLAHPAFGRLRVQVEAGRRLCRKTCAYFNLCGGGSPGNKYFETGRFDVSETQYCRLVIQQTVEETLAHLEAAEPLV